MLMKLTRRQLLPLVPVWVCGGTSAGAEAFDHAYSQWGALLQKHVRWLPDNKQSRVAYAGMAADRDALKGALNGFSALTPAGFAGFSRTQQMAFLINAYNAFTIELILTEYPKLASIKDIGSIVRSPWKKSFYMLLGEQRNLDWIEHEQLRRALQRPAHPHGHRLRQHRLPGAQAAALHGRAARRAARRRHAPLLGRPHAQPRQRGQARR